MSLTIENILLIGSLLLLISIIVGKTSYKFGVPTLLLFLSIGMLAGSDGIGGIIFDDPKAAQFIGIVSLIISTVLSITTLLLLITLAPSNFPLSLMDELFTLSFTASDIFALLSNAIEGWTN